MKRLNMLITAALLIGAFFVWPGSAQEPFKGIWEGGQSRWNGVESLYICLKSYNRVGERFSSCFDSEREKIKGLTFTPSSSESTPVHFEIIRDAGTFALDGIFKNGNGAGEYRFEPSADYVAGMKAMGYGDLSRDQVFVLALRDVSRGFIKELKALGYNDLPLDRLIRLRDHGVSIAYITDLKALGYSGLALEELIRLRDHGVSANYAKDLTRLGYKNLPLEQLVRLRDHGVSAAYIEELKGAGFSQMPLEEVV